ncbi:MAG: ParB N-terminal domain-containing protein [Nanoarchaeota archaeon]|nr:ParB N-terminal domain-containing protein [Nanoarchaeota archaeon]
MSKECDTIHKLFNGMKRLHFPFDENEIPINGIYILFEKGEKAHGVDRIVRVGTHTGANQLKSRLWQHFINENKDRSIFRKNIGRALLSKEKDQFLQQWEVDLTTKKAKEDNKGKINFKKQKEVEEGVTKYMQDNFSFIVFEVPEKEKRLKIESKIISTISLCDECPPSKEWLGLSSPKKKIRKSGLWLVNELYKEPLDVKELNELKKLLGVRNETLCRIFYIDTLLDKYTRSSEFDENLLKENIKKIKEDSEKLPIEEIKKSVIKINPNNKRWYERFEQKDFDKKRININNLIIEPWHNGLDGILGCVGKSIPEFVNENKQNKDMIERRDFILKHFDLITKYLPIIVKQNNNGKFDVMFGYHRVIASIEKGCTKIECLVIL